MSAPPPPRPRSRKRAETLARQIVETIVARGDGPGAKLPQEADMAAEHGVARSTLREALRLLEVQGLVTIRPGPGSGTEVGRVEAEPLSRTLALSLTLAGTSLHDLLAAWHMVEPVLARQAALNTDRADVTALIGPFAGDAAHDCDFSTGLAFHDAVSRAAGNPVLTLVLGAIGLLVTEQVRLGAGFSRLSDATLHSHAAIADAILAADADAAETLMRAHLDEVVREIAAHLPADRSVRLRTEDKA